MRTKLAASGPWVGIPLLDNANDRGKIFGRSVEGLADVRQNSLAGAVCRPGTILIKFSWSGISIGRIDLINSKTRGRGRSARLNSSDTCPDIGATSVSRFVTGNFLSYRNWSAILQKSAEFCGFRLGCDEGCRASGRLLMPPFAGSNPAAPASRCCASAKGRKTPGFSLN